MIPDAVKRFFEKKYGHLTEDEADKIEAFVTSQMETVENINDPTEWDIPFDDEFEQCLQEQELHTISHDIRVELYRVNDFFLCEHPPKIVKTITEYQSGNPTIFNHIHNNQYSNIAAKELIDYKKIQQKDTPVAIQTYILSPNIQTFNTIITETIFRFSYNYEKYWESVISELSRRHAIINRRQYLVENIDTILPLIQDKIFTDARLSLEQYRNFNLSEINKQAP